jgi:branched-chain amino acid transport system substrate-binding protein
VPLVGSNAPASLQSVVYIWRTSYVLDEPGRALGRYLKDRLPATSRVAIIAPETVGADVVKGFRQELGESDPRIADPVTWTRFDTNPDKTHFRKDIADALARKPDTVFCFYAGEAAVQFIKQLRAAGYRNTIYAPGFLTEGTVLSQLRDSETQGIETPQLPADLNNTGGSPTYARRTKHVSDDYAMASYGRAGMDGDPDRRTDATSQAVNLALGKIGSIDSPRGAWQFNQPRTPQQKWYLRRVQKNGQEPSNVLISELATLG